MHLHFGEQPGSFFGNWNSWNNWSNRYLWLRLFGTRTRRGAVGVQRSGKARTGVCRATRTRLYSAGNRVPHGPLSVRVLARTSGLQIARGLCSIPLRSPSRCRVVWKNTDKYEDESGKGVGVRLPLGIEGPQPLKVEDVPARGVRPGPAGWASPSGLVRGPHVAERMRERRYRPISSGTAASKCVFKYCRREMQAERSSAPQRPARAGRSQSTWPERITNQRVRNPADGCGPGPL